MLLQYITRFKASTGIDVNLNDSPIAQMLSLLFEFIIVYKAFLQSFSGICLNLSPLSFLINYYVLIIIILIRSILLSKSLALNNSLRN